MTLVVNGEPCSCRDGLSLLDLLREQGAEPARVATLLNGEVVARTRRETQALHEGDRVEILVFAGGG